MTEEKVSWKRQCLHADLVRLYGGLGIAYGGLLLFLFFANSGARETGGRDFSSTIFPALFFLIIGLGVLLERRIFAAVFSSIIGVAGVWMAIEALLCVHHCLWELVSIPFGVLMLLPARSTVIGWKALK